jgi:hypothetical protein
MWDFTPEQAKSLATTDRSKLSSQEEEQEEELESHRSSLGNTQNPNWEARKLRGKGRKNERANERVTRQ